MWVGACDSGVRRALPCSDLSGFALDDEWSAHTYDQPSSYERRKCVAELLPGSECAWPAAVDPDLTVADGSSWGSFPGEPAVQARLCHRLQIYRMFDRPVIGQNSVDCPIYFLPDVPVGLRWMSHHALGTPIRQSNYFQCSHSGQGKALQPSVFLA